MRWSLLSSLIALTSFIILLIVSFKVTFTTFNKFRLQFGHHYTKKKINE